MSDGRSLAVRGADYLARLARFAQRVRVDDLAPATLDAARNVVLDTLGAILAGSRLPENARLADLAAERSGIRTATPAATPPSPTRRRMSMARSWPRVSIGRPPWRDSAMTTG